MSGKKTETPAPAQELDYDNLGQYKAKDMAPVFAALEKEEKEQRDAAADFLKAADEIAGRAQKLSRAIAGICAEHNITEYTIGDVKYRVRKINGSNPAVYQLYPPTEPKERKAKGSGEAVNVADI